MIRKKWGQFFFSYESQEKKNYPHFFPIAAVKNNSKAG